MPPLHVQNINHGLIMFVANEIHVHFLWRKSLNQFSFTACHSTTLSNKQRQEHNNLATTWGADLRGAHALSTPRASSLSKNPNANPNKNGQGQSLRIVTIR
jgi:hypothetical protein